jgi:SAM-dependent methyltransferase
MRSFSEIDRTLSTYVQRCVSGLGAEAGLALDLACGAGRHSDYLVQCGYQVVAADLDIKRLAGLGAQAQVGPSAHRVRVDATNPLPFRAGTFDLIVVVHFVSPGLIANVTPLLRTGGYLLIETYGGQGENWRALPAPGQYRRELSSAFEVVDYYERGVGPSQIEAAAVRLFARRR